MKKPEQSLEEARTAAEDAALRVTDLEVLLRQARQAARARQEHYEELLRNHELGQMMLPLEGAQ